MLGLFSAKPDHPLAHAKEAKQVYAELAAHEPAAALEDAANWLESILNEPNFKPEQRIDIALHIHRSVLHAAERHALQYAALIAPSRSQEQLQWRLGHDFWSQLCAVYSQAIPLLNDKQGLETLKLYLPAIFVHAMNAQSARLKWMQFRYGPLPSDLWRDLNATYRLSMDSGYAQKSCALHEGKVAQQITPEQAFLQALVFSVSAMDSLLPREIEIAERLIAVFAPHFVFTNRSSRENVYWVDIAKDIPPTRLAKLPETTIALRFMNPGIAAQFVADALADIAKNKTLPSTLKVVAGFKLDAVVGVLEHLAQNWSPIPPQRSHVRHQVKSRVDVVSGFNAAYQRLAPDSSGTQDQSWVIEDVSLGGMRAQATLANNTALSVNSLLAIHPEGGSNWLLGVIRRFNKDSDASGSAGIETLSKTPQSICVDSGGIKTQLILLDPWESATHVRAALPATAWEDKVNFVFSSGGREVYLVPDAQVQSGSDYLIGRYRVRIAE